MVAHVGSVLNGKTAVADMAHLARLTENDPEGRAAVQATVRDHILRCCKAIPKVAPAQRATCLGWASEVLAAKE